ncbi:MAG: diadenosine tetraphosphate (Ap4A) HIT family hydrolase [Paracoccaceae bacterium]|jgi:diadenosine tetraphosphate (Ap4A) HIT family hydrolase
MFELDERLATDTCWLGDFPLCRALLMLDANYPWLILVPRRAGLKEIYSLSEQDQQQLMVESNAVAELMSEVFSADKMNTAALGNMVPQLHLHHIARFRHDAAWPKPVWGCVPLKHYENSRLSERSTLLKKAFLSANLHFEAHSGGA